MNEPRRRWREDFEAKLFALFEEYQAKGVVWFGLPEDMDYLNGRCMARTRAYGMYKEDAEWLGNRPAESVTKLMEKVRAESGSCRAGATA